MSFVPLLTKQEERMTNQSKEHREGYDAGWKDLLPHWWQRRDCSPEFLSGYEQAQTDVALGAEHLANWRQGSGHYTP